MRLKIIEVDQTLKEYLSYPDSSFPLSLCRDVYKYFANGTVNCHWHDALEFGIVLSGEVDYYINDTHILLGQGDCVFVNANAIHMSSYRKEIDDVAMFTLVFPTSLFAGNIDSTLYANYFRPIVSSVLQGFKIEHNRYGQIIKATIHEMSRIDPEEYGFELHSLSLLAKLWFATVNYIDQSEISLIDQNYDRLYEQRAKRMLSYVHQHYGENITIQDVARSAEISRTECFRCFKRVTNKKPMEYINEYRLSQASRLLLETDESITNICTSCGFGSSSYFGKLFKETFGVSPMQFRKQGSRSI